MQHITFEGTHFEMGFHWGSLLAKRGIFILERIPFPLTEERAALRSTVSRPTRRISRKF